jgi:hypothetical protein
MKVYITKYALTRGIIEAEVSRQRANEDGYVVVFWDGGLNGENVFGPTEWRWEREAAVARAEEMRKAKIASHKKQIARLEKLRFEEA